MKLEDLTHGRGSGKVAGVPVPTACGGPLTSTAGTIRLYRGGAVGRINGSPRTTAVVRGWYNQTVRKKVKRLSQQETFPVIITDARRALR